MSHGAFFSSMPTIPSGFKGRYVLSFSTLTEAGSHASDRQGSMERTERKGVLMLSPHVSVSHPALLGHRWVIQSGTAPVRPL